MRVASLLHAPSIPSSSRIISCPPPSLSPVYSADYFQSRVCTCAASNSFSFSPLFAASARVAYRSVQCQIPAGFRSDMSDMTMRSRSVRGTNSPFRRLSSSELSAKCQVSRCYRVALVIEKVRCGFPAAATRSPWCSECETPFFFSY